MTLALALLLGIVAGLRAMTPLAALSLAAHLGWLPLEGTWAAFLGHWITVAIFVLLAAVELITDQLPSTPSRTVPQQFGARLLTGGFASAVIGTAGGMLIGGLIAGLIGAVVGTYGGAAARARLAAAFGRDLPAALIEDLIAIGAALWIVASVA